MSSGIWDKVIEVVGDLNLPKLVAGPAGEAISRLIAGGADIPAAWLHQKAQAIKDQTEAKSLMTKTLAGASAEFAKNDPALVQRAAEAFIAKEIRHQHNREAVAAKAIEDLRNSPEAETTKPDDDWLNVFSRYAEDASSERLQETWGRILSGQLKRPKAFSLQTLRFVSELDEQIVSLFEKWSVNVASTDFIPFPANQGDQFTELLQLEDYGLIAGVTGQLSKLFNDLNVSPEAEVVPLAFPFKSHVVIVESRRPISVSIRACLLTRIGREIWPITKAVGSLKPIREFAEQFPKSNVEKIICLPLSGNPVPEILWQKQTDPSPQ
jgi:Protein of unknown function (DUF2806)